MSIGFCFGVNNYDPYYGSAGFRAVADNFSWPSIAAQGGSWYSFGGIPSIGSGFSFYPGGVFGGSCWSVPGGYYCSWNGPMGMDYYMGGFPAAYLPYFQYPVFSDLYAGNNGDGGGGGDAAPAKPAKRAPEPVPAEAPAAAQGTGDAAAAGTGGTEAAAGTGGTPGGPAKQTDAKLKQLGYTEADITIIRAKKWKGLPNKTSGEGFAGWYAKKQKVKLSDLGLTAASLNSKPISEIIKAIDDKKAELANAAVIQQYTTALAGKGYSPDDIKWFVAQNFDPTKIPAKTDLIQKYLEGKFTSLAEVNKYLGRARSAGRQVSSDISSASSIPVIAKAIQDADKEKLDYGVV